jgi:hypothetical protein
LARREFEYALLIAGALINGVVEQQIDPSELLECRLRGLVDCGGIQDVRLQTKRLATLGLDRRRRCAKAARERRNLTDVVVGLTCVEGSCGNRDIEPSSSKRNGRLGAYASARATYKCNSAAHGVSFMIRIYDSVLGT